METWHQVSENVFNGVDIPSGVDFYVNEDKSKMKIHVNNPDQDMQADAAAFEGWALVFHARLNSEIVLSFDPPTNVWSFSPGQGNYHYIGFLYRVWRFEEQMPWFRVDDACQCILNKFKTGFLQLRESGFLLNNVPLEDTKVDSEKAGEYQIEKAFAFKPEAGEILRQLVFEKSRVALKNIYDQLPVGLFKGSVFEVNRIFVTGFIDLWAISQENELCLFELKLDGNEEVGIISQLFFYANYCREFFMNGRPNEQKPTYRGYYELLSAVRKGIPKIRAYFLAPKFHARIEEHMAAIENYLNTNSPAIEYRFLNYDQDQIKAIADQMGKL